MSYNGGMHLSHGGYAFEDGECVVSVDFGLGQILDNNNNAIAGFKSNNSYENLPCYPDEVQSQISATWAEQTIIGRVGALVAYTGASDVSSSFSFDLHREHPVLGVSDYTGTKIDRIISLIKSGCYPKYGSGMLLPPITTFKFGDMWIDGRLMSVSDTWKKPIINSKYSICTISVQMTSISRRINSQSDIYNSKSPRSHPTWNA